MYGGLKQDLHYADTFQKHQNACYFETGVSEGMLKKFSRDG